MITAGYHFDGFADLDEAVERAVALLVAEGAVARLVGHDHTLFGPDPAECADRMGWTDIAERTLAGWDELVVQAEAVAASSDHVLVMGMGGSSLFPDVLARTFKAEAGYPELVVLDTTEPGAIARLAHRCPPERTFHIASSKSGATVETRSHLAWFWERSRDPSRFGVITDPGSALGADARAAGYAHVWENDPEIGGRYSALSMFGMVPAALGGVDGRAILDAALDQTDALAPLGDDAELNIALRLGAAIATAAQADRDRLTIVLDPRVAAFGGWLEQLVAESLGKHGVGSLPVVGEGADQVAAAPDRRLVVAIGDVAPAFAEVGAPRITLSLEEVEDLGAHVVLWEFAVAFAGRVLGVNPFDQPDVEAAKAAARELLDGPEAPQPPARPLSEALSMVRPGDAVVICAFVDPEGPSAQVVEEARRRIGLSLGVVTTSGFGPRFLHSTGQLHKGGPDDLVILQVLEASTGDLAVPNRPFTFGSLFAAQAAGDLLAFRDAGRRAARVELGELAAFNQG